MESVSTEKELEERLAEFTLGNEVYGIEVMRIKEIIQIPDITAVPQTLEFIEGIINLRGVIIPVVDLRKRFALPSAEKTKDTRIIVIELSNKLIGLIVDSVSEIISFQKSELESAPEILKTSIKRDYIKSIGKLKEKLIIILDIDLIFSDKEIKQF